VKGILQDLAKCLVLTVGAITFALFLAVQQ
jgi:hypothetical protein